MASQDALQSQDDDDNNVVEEKEVEEGTDEPVEQEAVGVTKNNQRKPHNLSPTPW
jgi:hypothetical protein